MTYAELMTSDFDDLKILFGPSGQWFDSVQLLQDHLADGSDEYEKYDRTLKLYLLFAQEIHLIENGDITPLDPDTLTKLAVVQKNLEYELGHEMFKFVSEELKALPLDERNAKMTELIARYPTLESLNKYFMHGDSVTDTEYLTDEFIDAVIEETKDGFTFDSLYEEIETVALDDTTPKINEEFTIIEKATDTYDANKRRMDQVDYNHSHFTERNVGGRLVPDILRQDFDREIHDYLEKEKKENEDPARYGADFDKKKKYFDEKFHSIEHLDDIIEMYREKPVRKQDITTRFLVNDITGEVMEIGMLNDQEKLIALARFTPDFDYREAIKNLPVIQNAIKTLPPVYDDSRCTTPKEKTEYKKRYDSLYGSRIKSYKKVHGDNWRQKEIDRIIDTFPATINMKKEKDAIAQYRQSIQEKTDRGEMVPCLEKYYVTLDEMSFVYQNFEMRNIMGEDKLVDKKTGRVVSSERTLLTFDFANRWANYFGNSEHDPTKPGFSPARAFSGVGPMTNLKNITKIAKAGVDSDGQINAFQLEGMLIEIGAEGFMESLKDPDGNIDIKVEQFFRIQSENAKESTRSAAHDPHISM